MARAPALGAGGRRFKFCHPDLAATGREPPGAAHMRLARPAEHGLVAGCFRPIEHPENGAS